MKYASLLIDRTLVIATEQPFLRNAAHISTTFSTKLIHPEQLTSYGKQTFSITTRYASKGVHFRHRFIIFANHEKKLHR